MLGFQSILVSCATAGAVLTYGVYRLSGRRSNREELIDEICEERESLRGAMAALPEQLEFAKRSRLSTSDATGRWLSELEADLSDARALESQLPPAEVDDPDRSGMELDLRLVEILTLSIRVNRIADKYAASVSAPATAAEPQFDAFDLHPSPGLPEAARALEPRLSAISP